MATLYSQRRTNSWRYGTIINPLNGGGISATDHEDPTSWTDSRTPEAKNPRRAWQIKNHYNAGTEMGFTYQTYERGYADVWCTYGPSDRPNRRFCTGEAFTSPPFPTSAEDPSGASTDLALRLASQKMLLKARQARTQLQSLVSAGEFGETLRMLRNPAKALFTGIRDYMNSARRRAKRVKKKHRNRVIQDTWLEYRFGWLPLASDIEGAYDALHDLPTSRYRKVSASHSFDTSGVSSSGNTTVGIFSANWVQNKTKSCSGRAYGEVGVDCSTPEGSLARFGISTSEFLPTVWELIPYSFVVDYFSNIGDAIAAGTFPSHYMSWTGMTSRTRITSKRYYSLSVADTMNNEGADSKDAGGSISPSSSERTVIYRRTAAYTGMGAARIQFEIPGLGLKWLNLAALKR